MTEYLNSNNIRIKYIFKHEKENIFLLKIFHGSKFFQSSDDDKKGAFSKRVRKYKSGSILFYLAVSMSE